ncbi:MAG: L-serine ammonia-lyase [Alphaproteobacteria bacterium]|jgi:L-serine dehydratase
MVVSVFDIFKVGVGPSSSHTVGPMRAGFMFVSELENEQKLARTDRIAVDFFGSLALTGKGHASHTAAMLGLSGIEPDKADPDKSAVLIDTIRNKQVMLFLGRYKKAFVEKRDIIMHYDKVLPGHPNAMTFTAFAADGAKIAERTYFSIGGGFVVAEEELGHTAATGLENCPYAFVTSDDLLMLCRRNDMSIAALTLENEKVLRDEEAIVDELMHIRDVMSACIDRGCRQRGLLPGGLKVRRRANDLYQNLLRRFENNASDPLDIMDWVNLWAFAVSEENAAGGRVVTAPTNGAAGIIPAVLRYYERFCPRASREGVIRFLLTAGAIGSVYKQNASISGAEVGCQGEVGVACSMAAAGLTAALEGTAEQVENAAEIGIEHNLGLTCDPVSGLVQIPCIERNAMGAMKAINAARLALSGDGIHAVSLDRAVETMRQTGLDMQDKYKETAKGGLAVNMVNC